MCGIAGLVGSGHRVRFHPEALKAMLGQMRHRGPDGEGVFMGDGAALGMRRLSIIDVACGEQPYFNETQRIVVVLNGEIWNHKELRQELEAKGHTFQSRADGEVISHLYEEWGEEGLHRLDGMFGFCLHDQDTRTTILARDREGIKPLLYADLGGTLAFSSELRPLVLLGAGESIDLAAVDAYLAFRAVPGESTILRGIRRLPPGGLLIHKGDTMTHRRLRPVPTTFPDTWNEDDLPEILRETIYDSLLRHLESDVPMGIFFSGGLDSTFLAGLLKRAGKKLPAYTAGYEGFGHEGHEFDEARERAEALGLDVVEIPIARKDIPLSLVALMDELDEPVGDATALPLRSLARRAARDVKVVISGEGADELFAGYPIYKEPLDVERFGRLLPPGVWKALSSARIPALPGAGLARRITIPVGERYMGVGATFTLRERREFLTPEISHYIKEHPLQSPESYARDAFSLGARGDWLNGMLAVDQQVFLVSDVLTKLDRVTMAAGLEARVPFLDAQVAALARRIPGHLKIKDGVEKWILREAARPELGAHSERKKRGFPTPIGRFMAGPMRDLAWDALLSPDARTRPLLKRDKVERLLRFIPDRASHGARQAYVLLTLELWLRQLPGAARLVPNAKLQEAAQPSRRNETLGSAVQSP